MAEAQQQQPQAHQPQPEPVFAAAEELAHVLPHQLLAKSSLSQATPEQEKRQGAQGQVRVEVQATTPPESFDVSGFDHPRARTSSLPSQPANNATNIVAVTHAYAQEQEQEQEQEQVREQVREQEKGYKSPQLFSSRSSTDAENSNLTSTPTTALPVTAAVTTTVAVDQATLPSATAAINGTTTPDQEYRSQQESTASRSPETMSNNPPHHHSGAPRQPTGYPTAYATPGMSSAHYGYPNPAGQGPDTYRASASVPNNAMALPSMRTFDPAQQQAQQQQHMAMAMPVNPVPSVPSMPAQQHMTYFGQQPVPMATNNPYALTPDALRPQYGMPQTGPGSVLGGRHKKVSNLTLLSIFLRLYCNLLANL